MRTNWSMHAHGSGCASSAHDCNSQQILISVKYNEEAATAKVLEILAPASCPSSSTPATTSAGSVANTSAATHPEVQTQTPTNKCQALDPKHDNTHTLAHSRPRLQDMDVIAPATPRNPNPKP
jgi:hypothetical protein